jgi:hypothetical protein
VVVSFDLVKIRLQDKANAGKYKNTLDCVKKIYAHEVWLKFVLITGILWILEGFGSYAFPTCCLERYDKNTKILS